MRVRKEQLRANLRVPKMTKDQERHYLSGQRAAWADILEEAYTKLGLDTSSFTDTPQYRWREEREEAITALRRACAICGDNSWPDELWLADIIERHLLNYLESPK